jgi:hypothetical protein
MQLGSEIDSVGEQLAAYVRRIHAAPGRRFQGV